MWSVMMFVEVSKLPGANVLSRAAKDPVSLFICSGQRGLVFQTQYFCFT